LTSSDNKKSVSVPRWDREQKAIKATQVAFDMSTDAQHRLKRDALEQHLNPSDLVRKILQLPYNKRPVRPRLTVSLKAEDFKLLAARYSISSENQQSIRERVAQELIDYADRLK
jgi:hypothetical protein